MANDQQPHIRWCGNSRDGRTNLWEITCPRCDTKWQPPTTRLAEQWVSCPKKKCGYTAIVNYNKVTA